MNKKRICQRRKSHSLINFFGCILLALAGTNLSAKESNWQDSLTFNGFYTLDLTYSDSNIPVTSNGNVIRLLEADKFTLKNSILGLQLQYEVTEALSLFLQGTALYNTQDESDLLLEWAYLSYDLGNDLTTRLGQFQIPFLQGTELKSIGYSRLWARPLVLGSGAGGFRDYTGVEFIKLVPLANSNLNFQVAIGKLDHDLDSIDGKLMGLLSATYDTRNFWIRAALLHADYEISTRDGVVIDDDAQAIMASIEAEAQYQNFIINAGLSNTKADITPDDALAYLSVAYQMGNFTPYILGKITRQHFDAFTIPTGFAQGTPPPPGSPPDGDNDTDSLAIGFRFDVGDNYAIKTQLEHISIEDNSQAAQGTRTESANVFSILLEGMF